MRKERQFYDEETGLSLTGTSYRNGEYRVKVEHDVDVNHNVKVDRARYRKMYVKHYFAFLELSAMGQRCWSIITFYLNTESEFFYMTKEAMATLCKSHFGKAPHEKNIAAAFRELVKKGFILEIGDGLWMVNHLIAFNGDRKPAIIRHIKFDLFGTRDPMARNDRNKGIDYSTSIKEFFDLNNLSPKIIRDRCLGNLRKASKISTIK